MEKSKCYASREVTRHEKEILNNATQIRLITNNLGFNIMHEGIQILDFNHIAECINSKLATWKSNLSNIPGRLILANIILSYSVLWHTNYLVSQYVCDYIDWSVRRFILKDQHH